jgi:RNA polymerase sigma-70 factor (ECF subfamily)
LAQVVSPIQGLPPVVIRTEPVAGETHVDSGLREIRITFSKEMLDKSWSLVQWSRESFPTIVGEIRYLDDRRTCVIPVKLEPGKPYVIWANTDKHVNFKDEGGRSALPYLLAFETVRK